MSKRIITFRDLTWPVIMFKDSEDRVDDDYVGEGFAERLRKRHLILID